MTYTKVENHIEIEKTSKALIRWYYRFVNSSGIGLGTLALDTAVVKDVAKRYYRDVARLRYYHPLNDIDSHKVAGYLSYWLCKLRPIRATKYASYNNSPQAVLCANETFAICFTVGLINDRRKRAGLPNITLTASVFNALRYTLRYRPVTGDLLAIIYCLAEKA